jgi:SAM-dependent methyltransferase
MDEVNSEIPSAVDFNDPAQVNEWITRTVQKRVWRPRFFSTFASTLNDRFERPFDVIELGSGPGHLAKAVVEGCSVASYTAVDLSVVMHRHAREHLGDKAGRVRLLLRDFRRDDWTDGLPSVDAVLTMQSAHEVRHRSRQPALLKKVHEVLKPGGTLLFCDHYFEPGTERESELYLPREQQAEMIRAAGFAQVTRLLDLGGMALYRALRA